MAESPAAVGARPATRRRRPRRPAPPGARACIRAARPACPDSPPAPRPVHDVRPAVAAESRPVLRIALVGNPTSGKTALFNALTGARQKVAN